MTFIDGHAGNNYKNSKDNSAKDVMYDKRKTKKHWDLQDITWNKIDFVQVRNDPLTYYIITAASFIETAADLYTSNLVKHFPDPKAQQWLINYWQPEELQHGLALRTYVETVWPEYNWQTAYEKFLAEYSRFCTPEELEPSRALEMVARCVVEAGTSSFYTTLQQSSKEPVLTKLAGLIRQDEVSHYKHFRQFFDAYKKQENIRRIDIIRSLYKRLTEVETEDAYIGVKYAWLMRYPDKEFHAKHFDTVTRDLRLLLAGYYPYRMAIKMLLRPLDLNRTLVKLSLPLLEQAARGLMFR